MLNENHDYYNYIVYVYTVFCNDFLKAQPNISLLGVPTQTFIFHFALVGRNMQASFGLKVIWESLIADFLLMTLGFGQK